MKHCLLISVFALSFPAFAADSGANGAAGDGFGSATSGYGENSAESHQDFDKSREHMREYKENHDPGEFHKAVGFGRRGMLEALQAMELARNALADLNSQSKSQNSPNEIPPSQIVELQTAAGSISPEAQQMQQMFQGYGVDLGGSAQAVAAAQDAPGTMNDKLAAADRSPAAEPSDSSTNGKASTTAAGSIGAFATGPSAGAGYSGLPGSSPDGSNKDVKGSPSDPGMFAGLGGGGGGGGGKKSQAAVDRKTMLERNRAAFLRKMVGGAEGGVPEPILSAMEDIFAVIHKRYETKDGEGVFFGDRLPASTSPPLEQLTAIGKQTLQINRNRVIRQMGPQPEKLVPFSR